MQSNYPIVQFSLTIVRNKEGKFLSVLEAGNQGWWVPGGGVDPGQTCRQAGIRQCKEEAGIDIVLKGVLRIENTLHYNYMRQRIIYYAEPVDEKQPPKSVADHQSILARWMSVQQILAVKKQWRGHELYDWANYVHRGGPIYPLDVLQQ